MTALLVSAVSVAFFHSLAPDHWLPFVALAKGSRWTMGRLGWVTFLAGIGHVASSLLLGFLGLWAGLAIHPETRQAFARAAHDNDMGV
jgi:hypothetical protein